MKGDNGGDSDVEEQVFEYTIVYIAKHDAWIMPVLKCIGFEEARGG